jgi:hypothetical protein
MRQMLALLSTLLLAGCEGHNEVIEPGTLSSPVSVGLHRGQAYRVTGTGLTARFDSVTSDSRCPQGAMCIWAGDGATRISIFSDWHDAVTCTLHTTLSPQQVATDGYSFRLSQLLPYPRVAGPIDPSAYIAVLTIASIPPRQ